MGMQKYGDNQPAEVFVGEEAVVVSSHLQRTGKALSDFSEEERNALDEDLAKFRPESKDDPEPVATHPQETRSPEGEEAEVSSAPEGELELKLVNPKDRSRRKPVAPVDPEPEDPPLDPDPGYKIPPPVE